MGKKNHYKVGRCKLCIENHSRFSSILKNSQDTLFAILDGEVIDKNSKAVLTHGDIVKTDDLKVLSKVFKIKNNLTLLKVTK